MKIGETITLLVLGVWALILVLVLALGGCTTTRQYRPAPNDPGDTDLAFRLLVRRLPEVYPEIPQAGALAFLRSISVTFTAEDRHDSDGDPVAGMTYMPRLVWVKRDERYTDARTSALVHEAHHALLWYYHGDPDPNHAAPGGAWTTATDVHIVSVMQELAKDPYYADKSSASPSSY